MGNMRDMDEWMNHCLWKWSISFHRGPTVEMGRGLVLPRTLRNRWRALEMKCLSLWELWNRNLKGGLLYWGCWRIHKRRLWKWPSLSIWAPLGIWRGRGGTCLPKTLRDGHRRVLETVCTPLWQLCKGNLEGGLLYWEPWKLCKTCQERLWKWSISLFIQGLWGEPERKAPTMRTQTDK